MDHNANMLFESTYECFGGKCMVVQEDKKSMYMGVGGGGGVGCG